MDNNSVTAELEKSNKPINTTLY